MMRLLITCTGTIIFSAENFLATAVEQPYYLYESNSDVGNVLQNSMKDLAISFLILSRHLSRVHRHVNKCKILLHNKHKQLAAAQSCMQSLT